MTTLIETVETATSIPLPLRIDGDGVLRFNNSRITPYFVVHAHWDGMTPEQIVERFDTLELADVYAFLSFYVSNRAIVDQYVEHVERDMEAAKARIEAQWPRDEGFRTRLVARRDAIAAAEQP
jgi:uncharacterized protein (DUF433 family)